MRITTGRVLPAIPRSANHTSPWRGFIAVNGVQDLLLNFAVREHVGPLVFLALVFEELEVMPQFPQDRLALGADFLDQPVLGAHGANSVDATSHQGASIAVQFRLLSSEYSLT